MAKAATKSSKKISSSKKKESPEELKKKDDAAKNISKPLVEKAVSALVKYHNEQAMKKQDENAALSLLGNDSSIQVQFGLEVPPAKQSPKPIRVMIPHPIHKVADSKGDDDGLEEVDVCLIVKDGSKPWVQEMVNEFKEHMGCVKKVLSLESLRKKHSLFHQRRELLNKYDIFMADDRILPMLTSALGKDFVKAKKLPVPLQLTRKEALPLAIQKNLSATYLTIPAGTSISIRAGNTGMPIKKLVENVAAIAENAVDKIPRKWANIRSIAIKTPESTSLPFYNKTPEELLKIAEMAGVHPAFKDTPEDDKEAKDDADEKKRKLAAKSPLVRALKKQKKESEDNKKEDDGDEELEGEEGKASEKKGKAAQKSRDNNSKEEDVDKREKKKKKKTSDVDEKTEKEARNKKRRKESEDEKAEETEAPPSPSKKSKSKEKDEKTENDFIASKKFKGSKKGYVFRAGKQGLGYYKDVKPVVDKMVLQALFRANEQGGKRGRSKSGGKRKGRR